MPETLTFPPAEAAKLDPYLPPLSTSTTTTTKTKPWLTLTYATSLDAAISLSPGTQTVLSGPESKAMTHHLRSRHDGILVGVGTALADDPGLNCRIEGCGLDRQPRPIVLDPRGRWDVGDDSKVVRLAREGKGKGPWVLVGAGTVVSGERRRVLEGVGGRIIVVDDGEPVEGGGFGWDAVLGALGREGLGSVMVEGGGRVINSLLGRDGIACVNSVIVTIAPRWLGQGGVVVSPERGQGEEKQAVARLRDMKWCPLGEDVVLCGFPEVVSS